MRMRCVVWAGTAAIALALAAPAAAQPGDRDVRRGKQAPTAAQKRAAKELRATVRWNRYGTARSVVRRKGWLGTRVRARTAGAAARRWIGAHRSLFRLRDARRLEP